MYPIVLSVGKLVKWDNSTYSQPPLDICNQFGVPLVRYQLLWVIWSFIMIQFGILD